MIPHRNNIGALRLLFASLVIVGHAPEMVDGDRSREPLTAVFHTVSLGDLSVDAFFILSGFLLANSIAGSRSVLSYVEKRVFRIYPAFILAYLLSVFALGPLVGARPWLALGKTFEHLARLQPPPEYPGQLAGLRTYPSLNDAMWTIAYEFRCYLLLAALALTGLLRRRGVVLALTAAGLALSVLITFDFARARLAPFENEPLAMLLVGRPMSAIRLTSVFLVGVCFHLYRGELLPRLTAGAAAACGLLATALLWRNPHLAEAGLVVFGGATLIWLAIKAPLGPAQRINDRWDISYGVYLYGWPVASLVRWIALPATVSPWLLAAVSLPAAMALGAASWFGLEKRAIAWARSRAAAADGARSRGEPGAALQGKAGPAGRARAG